MLDRVQEGARRADPTSVFDDPLEVAHPGLGGAVVIIVAGNAEAHRAVDEGIANGLGPVDIRDGEFAVPAVEV